MSYDMCYTHEILACSKCVLPDFHLNLLSFTDTVDEKMEKARPLWKQSALRYWMSPRNRFTEVQVVGAIDPRTGVQVKGKPDPQAESRIVGSIPEGITIFRSIILVVMRIWWESMMAPFKQRWRDFLLLCNTVHVLLDDCTKQPSWELRHLLSPWCFFWFQISVTICRSTEFVPRFLE